MPDAWLWFHDDTPDLEQLHNTVVTLRDGRIEHSSRDWLWEFRSNVLVNKRRSRGIDQWTGRISDIFPHFDNFVTLCHAYATFDPSVDRHGRWLNPLGRWDIWEVASGFNGRITGQVRMPGAAQRAVSSGPSFIRDTISNIVGALQRALDQEPAPTFDVRADENVERVVLPPDSVPDEVRWTDSWPKLRPMEALAALGVKPDATFADALEASYAQFQDHWAAAIAYHH